MCKCSDCRADYGTGENPSGRWIDTTYDQVVTAVFAALYIKCSRHGFRFIVMPLTSGCILNAICKILDNNSGRISTMERHENTMRKQSVFTFNNQAVMVV